MFSSRGRTQGSPGGTKLATSCDFAMTSPLEDRNTLPCAAVYAFPLRWAIAPSLRNVKRAELVLVLADNG